MSWGIVGPNARRVLLDNPKLSSLPFQLELLTPTLQWGISRERSVFWPEQHLKPASLALHGHLRMNSMAPARSPQEEASEFATSFQKWGLRLGEKVHGDYAALIWDQNREQWTGFVDPFGVKQFFYAVVEGHLFYAFDLPSLLGVLPKAPELRLSKVISFLCRNESDGQNTFHQGVRRLLPGQFLRWSAQGALSFEIWHPLQEPSPVFPLNGQQWVEAFRERFIFAVQSRANKSPLNTGCQLSGGLDSSSIVAAALIGRSSPLTTTSLIFPNHPTSDEREYIDAMVSFGGLRSIQIDTSALNPFTSMPDWLKSLGEPYLCPNFYFTQLNYQKAAEGGLQYLLDGMDGDTVVSHGIAIPNKLFKQGRFWAMWQALKAIGDTFSYSPQTLLKRRILKPLIPQVVLDFRTRLQRQQSSNGFHPNMDLGDFFRQPYLEEAMKSEVNEPVFTPHSDYPIHHALEILSPSYNIGMEMDQAMARRYGLEIAYPFFDLELIQLCLNLPDEMKISQGYTRYVLRSAMVNLMPERVRWRKQKSKLGPHLDQAFLYKNWKEIWAELHNMDALLAEMIDIPKVIRYWEECRKFPELFRYYNVWTLLCLNFWLRQWANR